MGKSSKRKHDQASHPLTADTNTTSPAPAAPKAAEVISSEGHEDDGAAKKQKGAVARVLFKHGASGVERSSKIDTSKDLRATSIRVAAKLDFPPDVDVRLVQVREGGREAEIWDDFDFDAFRNRALANPSQRLVIKVYPSAGPSTSTAVTYPPSAYRTPQSQPAARPVPNPSTPTPASLPAKSNFDTPRTTFNGTASNVKTGRTHTTPQADKRSSEPGVSPGGNGLNHRKMRRLQARQSLGEEGGQMGGAAVSPNQNPQTHSSAGSLNVPTPPSSTKKDKKKKQRKKKADQPATPISTPSIARPAPTPPINSSIGKRKRSASPVHPSSPASIITSVTPTIGVPAAETTSEQPKKKKKKKDKSLPTPTQGVVPTLSPAKSIPPELALPTKRTGRPSLLSKAHYQPVRPSPLGQFSTSAVTECNAALPEIPSAHIVPTPPSITEVAVETPPLSTAAIDPPPPKKQTKKRVIAKPVISELPQVVTSEVPAVAEPSAAIPSVSTPTTTKPGRPKKARASSTTTASELPQSPIPATPSEPGLSAVAPQAIERPSSSREVSADTANVTTSDPSRSSGKSKVGTRRIAKPKAKRESQTALHSMAIMAEFRALKAAEEAKKGTAVQVPPSLAQGDSSAIQPLDDGAVNVAVEEVTTPISGAVLAGDQSVSVLNTNAPTPVQKKRKGKGKLDAGETTAAGPVIPDALTTMPKLTNPAKKPTKRGEQAVSEKGSRMDGYKEKRGKRNQVQAAPENETVNTPVPPALGNDASPVAVKTSAAEGVRKRKKATSSVPVETAASAPAGDVGDDGKSVPTLTTQGEVVETTLAIEPPAPAVIATVAGDVVEPTAMTQTEPPQNTFETSLQSAATPQTPVVSKRAKKDKEKKGKVTTAPTVDISNSTAMPATAAMDHPTPVIQAEPVDADVPNRPTSLRTAAMVERAEAPEVARQAPQTTATPAKPTTTATSNKRTISAEAVPLIIQPISTPSSGFSAQPAKKPAAKLQKYIKPPPLPRGESGGPEKPTCLICGVVISHMQKDCPVVLAGIDALGERLEVVRKTPKSRDRTLALETIGGWVKRLEEIKKRREAFEAAQADAERDAGDEDREQEDEEDGEAETEEDEMFAPPSPSSAEPTQRQPTGSPVEQGIAIADEEAAINTRETDVAPHPPMIGDETRSSPLVEQSPLPNPAALLPLSPIPSVSARPRSESSSSSATSSTSESASSRSSLDSSEAVKTPSTAQPVSADPSLPAIFLRGLKKHHRPGSTSAVSVSTAFIETEDSDSASVSESISSSGKEDEEQEPDFGQHRLKDDGHMDGEADEDEEEDEDEGRQGQAFSSAVTDSVLDENDDMDGDDEADDTSHTTSRVIGRLALPRQGTASREATSTSPVIRSAETVKDAARESTPLTAPAKRPNPTPDSTDAESDSDDSSSNTSSPRSSVLPFVPSPTLHPSTVQPTTTTELPDAETMFKQFFSRPLSQRERAQIKAASQGQQSVSLRPDVEDLDEEDDDVESTSEAPVPAGGDDASSIGDFGSVAGGDRDDSIEAEEGVDRVVQPVLAHAEDDLTDGGAQGVMEAEDEASEQQDEGDDGEDDEDDEIRSDRTSVPLEPGGTTEQAEDSASAIKAIEAEDPTESEYPDAPNASKNGPDPSDTDSIPDLPLSQADEPLPSQQSPKTQRSASQRSTNVITYSRRSARFKQLDDKGGESEAIDEFAGSVALAEARAEEATPEPLSLASQPNGDALTSADESYNTPKARGRIARSVSSSQSITDESQQTDTPNGSLPNGTLTRRRSSRLRSAEVEVVIPLPPSRQRRASTHSQASQNGTSASQLTPKAPLDILVEDSDELAQNGTPRVVRSSQVDQLNSSQPSEAPLRPVTPPTQKERIIPATPTSRKVAKILPPSSPATSARSTRSTSRSRAQSPLFMSQSQPLATQAYIARPQSLASSSPSLRTPVGAKAGKRGKKGDKVVTSPIVEEEEEEEEEADAELQTPRARLKVDGRSRRDPLSSPSPPVENGQEEPEEEEEEQEYFSQADLSSASDTHSISALKINGGRGASEVPEEADDDDDDNDDEAASSIALPPILSRPILPPSQPPPQSQMSFAPSLSSLPMDLLRSGVTAFAAFTGIGSQPIPKGPNGSSQSLIRDLDLGGGREEEESESGSGESSSDDDDDDDTPGGRGRNGKGGKSGLRGRYVQSEKEKDAAKKRRARPLGW